MTTEIQTLVKRLILQPDFFTPSHAQAAITELMANRATPAQVAAFIVALKLHRKDADPHIVAACASKMLEFAVEIDFAVQEGLQDALVDVVGTGGDGMNTFNVSTTAAIVIAGAGCKVAKFGNRASSSQSGSADILESLGCVISNVTASCVPEIISSNNFCFLFAQAFHPAMKYVAGPRREVGVPTIFNLLGPLVNPAKPKRVVIGVHSIDLGNLVIEALRLRGLRSAMVVHGACGLDEISPDGETHVWHLKDSEITQYSVTPEDFGLPNHAISTVTGGAPKENADTLLRLLSNQYQGPILDFVLLNASAALVVAGCAKDFKEGVVLARESITSGRALKALVGFKEATLKSE